MAIINKTGITDGGTIQAAHVARAIDALSGGSTDTVIATGSFSGSFTGPLTGTASFAVSSSMAISSSFATTAITSSHIQSSTLNQNLTVNGSFFISSSITHLSPRYVTTTNDTITDIYNFGAGAIGTARTIETMVLGVTASAGGLSASTGTTGGNYMGVFSINETPKILGETSSSFTSGFTTAGTPEFGLRDASGLLPLRFFVKGLPNETINWVVSIRILGN
jgi:hypothetical protein